MVRHPNSVDFANWDSMVSPLDSEIRGVDGVEIAETVDSGYFVLRTTETLSDPIGKQEDLSTPSGIRTSIVSLEQLLWH